MQDSRIAVQTPLDPVCGNRYGPAKILSFLQEQDDIPALNTRGRAHLYPLGFATHFFASSPFRQENGEGHAGRLESAIAMLIPQICG